MKEKESKATMLNLFLVSLVSLFFELILIRWIGTEVRFFAYMQNLALITCFLGFGVGCLQSRESKDFTPSLYKLLLLGAIMNLPIVIGKEYGLTQLFSELLTLSPDAALWGFPTKFSKISFFSMSVVAVVTMIFVLWLIASMMIPFGRWVGYCLDNATNVPRAYAINLLGSLVGTWLLLLLSLFNLSPVYWFLLAFILISLMTPKSKMNWGFNALLFAAFFLISFSHYSKENIVWSPYQKLHVSRIKDSPSYKVMVNNTSYMTMIDSTEKVQPPLPNEPLSFRFSSYDSPFMFVSPNPSVLIVGAGAGNDASAALRNGASQIDAVEIDPVIYALGKKMHPDRPYDSNKVNVVINDAREFFGTTQKKYDAIIFGFLDSHTGFSSYSNMRVDNYVYTKEAFEKARQLLKPDGVLVMKFEVRSPWLWMGQRFNRALTEVFGHEPIVYHPDRVGNFFSGTVFLESNSPALWQKAEEPAIKEFLSTHAPVFSLSLKDAPEAPSDDWPYVYHRNRSVPGAYLTVSVLLLAVSFFMIFKSNARFVRLANFWTSFFLGFGFLLMETQLISRLGLYFGSTWLVNSIAISAILCFLVLANLIVEKRKKPFNMKVLYALLIVTIFANYFFPWDALSYPPKVIGTLLSIAYAVPVLFSGIIFSITLRDSENKAQMLGANIWGSIAGGLAQNLSFIVGLKALLIIAALGYLIAAVKDKTLKLAKP